MNKNIKRNYLEIKSLNDLNESKNISNNNFFVLQETKDFQLNKFFYKNIGKSHHWVDRLNWTEKQWSEYIENKSLKTYVLKDKENLIGYFELIFHQIENEVEIAYLGLLEEYHNKNLGSYLLTLAIKKSFENTPKRVWVHTCSLDHENALKNYLARGMKIFKQEVLKV